MAKTNGIPGGIACEEETKLLVSSIYVPRVEFEKTMHISVSFYLKIYLRKKYRVFHVSIINIVNETVERCAKLFLI